MAQIIAAGLGTMFTVQGGKVTSAQHVSQMQTLAWLAKDNRPAASRKTGRINHAYYPRDENRLLTTPADAYAYAAEAIEHNWSKCYSSWMGVDPRKAVFVPLPASNITPTSGLAARWPARALAAQLVKRGLGTLCPGVVNREARSEQASNRSQRTPAHEIAANTVIIARPPLGSHVVFVDDVITWGNRMAASHYKLNWPGPVGALCVAFTNDDPELKDCYTPKRRAINYDASSIPWSVSIERVGSDDV